MNDNDRGAVLTIAAFAPLLTLKLGWRFLGLKRSANKARKRFFRELVSTGVPREQASALADDYVQLTSVRSMIRNLRGNGWREWTE